MLSVAGLTEIGFCDAGTLETTKTNAAAMGIRNATELQITPFNQIEAYRNQKLRNMLNFKWEGESYQPTMSFLEKVLNWIRNGVDVQIKSVKQTPAAASENIFKFTGNNKLGLNFEYVIDSKKRFIKPILEGAMDFEDAKAFLDTADSESAVDLGFTLEGKDYSLRKAPYFLAIQVPKTVDLVSKYNVVERSFMLKGKGKKLERNIDKVDYITATLSVTMETASISDMITILAKNESPSFLLKEKNNGDFYDGFDIKEGMLTQSEDFKIGDNNRTLSVTYEGDIPVNYFALQLGLSNGSDESDTEGITGGTLVVG